MTTCLLLIRKSLACARASKLTRTNGYWTRVPLHAVYNTWLAPATALQWRHNEREGVSNHQPHDCLLNRLFRRRSKKTSKLRVTGLCAGNSPGTGEFPAQMASYAENVSIWWRHHGLWITLDSLWHWNETEQALDGCQLYFWGKCLFWEFMNILFDQKYFFQIKWNKII